MKIVHLSSAHPIGDPRIQEKQCRSLVAAGHEVTLVLAGVREQISNGIQIRAVEATSNRLMRMTVTAARVAGLARTLAADLYHLHDPELLPLGLLLREQVDRPVIYDSHEFVALDIWDKNWIPAAVRGIVARGVGGLETFCAKRLDAVIAVNPYMAQGFAGRARRVAVVGNYPPRALAEFGPALVKTGPEIINTGPMSASRGFPVVIEAMRTLRRELPQARCSLYGSLDLAEMPLRYTKLSTAELAATGVQFCERVPFSELPGIVRQHRVGWIPLAWTGNHAHCTPTKLLEFMAAGLPVVVSDLPVLREIVESADCGLVVPWNDASAHADAFAFLLRQPDECARLGENGRQAILRELNWERQFDVLQTLYREVLADEGRT
jgi:glycosyltransferase involved in cell wall biosynthesis